MPPEIPKNSSVVYNGNDRSFSDSFKVGSTVQYRCSLGHIVQGQSLRTCETSGHWSDAPPICVCKCYSHHKLVHSCINRYNFTFALAAIIIIIIII